MKYNKLLSIELFKQQNEHYRPLKFIFIIILLSMITLLIIFNFDPLNKTNVLLNKNLEEINEATIFWEQWLEPLDFNIKKIPKFEKFVLSQKIYTQLGNQMFRYSAIYAIGQMLNRTPVYSSGEKKVKSMDNELKKLFPNFYSRIYFLRDDVNDTYTATLSKNCCDYVDPKILLKLNNKSRALVVENGVFLSIRYFEHLRSHLIKLFEFSKEINEEGLKIKKKMFDNDNSFKICVHTRVGDFVANGVSNAGEVVTAIEKIYNLLKNTTKNTKFSLLMFGTDIKFLKELKINKTLYNKYYTIFNANMTRGVELNFATQSCDSFLITAPTSSYGFWMAYLMPQDRPIFYIPRSWPFNSKETVRESWISIDKIP